MERIKIENLLDLDQTLAKELFLVTMASKDKFYPWEIVSKIGAEILTLARGLDKNEYYQKGENVWISKTAKIAPTACIEGPAIIDKGAEIRHGAYIRQNVIVGRHVVVGNSTEVKNTILFNGVQVPHFNYVGDSILGYKAHMGGGAMTANLRSDKTPISVNVGGKSLDTGLMKLGAIIGDRAEIGANAVLNPGVIIGRNSIIYPLTWPKNFVPENCLYKVNGEICNRSKKT